jgi:hypothetical protein
MFINMSLALRKIIRNLIIEDFQKLKVINSKQVGLDHLNKFKIFLSNGAVDYIDKKNAVITNSSQADYKCANISGIIKSESNFIYSFIGVNCDNYTWIDVKSIQIIN